MIGANRNKSLYCYQTWLSSSSSPLSEVVNLIPQVTLSVLLGGKYLVKRHWWACPMWRWSPLEENGAMPSSCNEKGNKHRHLSLAETQFSLRMSHNFKRWRCACSYPQLESLQIEIIAPYKLRPAELEMCASTLRWVMLELSPWTHRVT